MTGQQPGIPRWISKMRAAWLLLALWCLSLAASLFLHQYQISQLAFWDPDDAMRLVEVRDFLAGQGWFDVSQHRANPPFGSPMHWSRLVDLPIAGFILLLRPIVGPHLAETGAVLLTPALTLAAMLGALYWAVRALTDKAGALLCCVALIASPTALIQFPLLRIDHHAWQIVMAALAAGGCLHRKPLKGGAIAGLALAIWLQISIEGLPFAALFGALMAFRYASSAREWPRLSAYLWTLTCVSATLFLLTHGGTERSIGYCDALSPAYLVPLGIVPLAASAAHRILGWHTPARRALAPGLAACAGLAVFAAGGSGCLAGPFGSLDPLVAEFWYKAVLEGLPVWRQGLPWVCFVMFALGFAIIGNSIAIAQERDRSRKLAWLCFLMLLSGASVLSLLVFRTFFVAHVLGLPGTVALIRTLFVKARSLDSLLLRVPATAMSSILLFPLVTAAAMAASLGHVENDMPARIHAPIGPGEVAALESIAPATIFAPIDMSPSILMRTRHSIIGTGHHRNARGMQLVISGFLASPRQARQIVSGSPATYLLIGFTGETERYLKKAPQGLAAQLLSGRQPPGWLLPVQLPGLKGLRLYRIDRAAS